MSRSRRLRAAEKPAARGKHGGKERWWARRQRRRHLAREQVFCDQASNSRTQLELHLESERVREREREGPLLSQRVTGYNHAANWA